MGAPNEIIKLLLLFTLFSEDSFFSSGCLAIYDSCKFDLFGSVVKTSSDSSHNIYLAADSSDLVDSSQIISSAIL